MRTYKAIAFAYRYSVRATELGWAKTGCWYVEQTVVEAGNSQTGVADNCKGFDAPDHPDLITCYFATEGEMGYSFRMHGNADALKAIAAYKAAEKPWENAGHGTLLYHAAHPDTGIFYYEVTRPREAGDWDTICFVPDGNQDDATRIAKALNVYRQVEEWREGDEAERTAAELLADLGSIIDKV